MEQQTTNCVYQWKGDVWKGEYPIETCCKPATHKHSTGLPLCRKHYNKTLQGTISTHAWRHKKCKSKNNEKHISRTDGKYI